MEGLEEVIRLFNYKSEYLRHSALYDEIDLDSFLELLFMFDENADFPFEDKNCEEYRRWRDNTEVEEQYKFGQPYVYNSIVLFSIDKENKNGEIYEGKENKLILRNDDEVRNQIRGCKNAYMSPVTYVGRRASYKNARFMFAIVFDLDGVEERHISNLFERTTFEDKTDSIPRPNIVVNSGNGLHLYYLLEKPIPLFDDQIKILNQLKHSLTTKIWNTYTSIIPPKERQYQGIVQAFRLPESLTKFGKRIRAFHDSEVPRYTIEELNKHSKEKPLTQEDVDFIDKGKRLPNRLTLDGAKLKYPEWYQERIVEGKEKRNPKKWNVNRGLYDWWLKKLWIDKNNEIVEGHRYFCLYSLVCFAVKCGVPYEEVEDDVYSLIPKLDRHREGKGKKFEEKDAKSALKAYYDENSNRITRAWIEKHSNFRIDETKRNGRTQEAHLRRERMFLDDERPNWREGNGRKPKKDIVLAWRKDNPNGTKYRCVKETGLSKPTVYKWWTAYDEYLQELAKDGKYLSTDIFELNQP